MIFYAVMYNTKAIKIKKNIKKVCLSFKRDLNLRRSKLSEIRHSGTFGR